MTMAVISRPHLEHNHTGKIFMKRVSAMEAYKKTTHHQNFSDAAFVNAILKEGEWRECVADEGTNLGDLKDSLQEQYDLDDGITEKLVLRYYLKDKKGKDKAHYLVDDETPITGVRAHRDNMTLMVRMKAGEEREVDVSCDSNFMEITMQEVGEGIRSSYHWVPMEDPIFLYLDNAGGHGTKMVVAAYVKMLADDFNVICIHQCPRSPATNMLDLGAWMAMQSVVEKEHYGLRKNPDALWRTMQRAWEILLPQKLANIYARWKLILDLIIEDKGGDRLIESRRGKKSLYTNPSD